MKRRYGVQNHYFHIDAPNAYIKKGMQRTNLNINFLEFPGDMYLELNGEFHKLIWDDSTKIKFAISCIERALPKYFQRYPDDQLMKDSMEKLTSYIDGGESPHEDRPLSLALEDRLHSGRIGNFYARTIGAVRDALQYVSGSPHAAAARAARNIELAFGTKREKAWQVEQLKKYLFGIIQ